MNARKTAEEIAVRHPRETSELFGHREAEAALLAAYRSGRIPHAWLIGGPQGVGKATLAYRMARFVLAHRHAQGPDVQRATTLAVDPGEHVARQVAANAHGGLLVTVADMVMGVGSGFVTGIRWPHPTITLNCDFVRGAKLGHWLEGKAIVSRRTINFCFCRTELVCDGEVVLNASGVFRVPDLERVPEQFRPPKAT